ncbi:aromatic ring-opening dioxygenase LigB subunit [Penicillium hispanicum]|uniref:aromatic ring-opening dioxygenase LigB subunit n=1 Tax=Penicillium hispanicum TaxID=1080232 RepID=UPI0025409A16|nr:aromatic ring-opening dioxygenase LigB subunit [Penicillium hispanicum]KAJ5587759.1 aromatic ring-opening dioxygenase LigB subunit [Penicillium hispanicum]
MQQSVSLWMAIPKVVDSGQCRRANRSYSQLLRFSPHRYEYDYPNKGSPEIAGRVIDKFGAGIELQRVIMEPWPWCLGLDFDPPKNPLYEFLLLGSLRDDGILIIGVGMAVHDLREVRATRGSGQTMPYTFSFDETLKEATTADPAEGQMKMSAVMSRRDTGQLYPTFEHMLAIHVVAGTAGRDIGKRLVDFT